MTPKTFSRLFRIITRQMLDEETDQNKLYDLQGQLAAFNLFTEETLNAFATIF